MRASSHGTRDDDDAISGRGSPAPRCSSKRTEADFEAWRDQRDWTERKYAMRKAGERMPSQKPRSLMKCPCGEIFDSHRLEETVVHVSHISTVEPARVR